MFCSNCGTENKAGSKFCSECSSALTGAASAANPAAIPYNAPAAAQAPAYTSQPPAAPNAASPPSAQYASAQYPQTAWTEQPHSHPAKKNNKKAIVLVVVAAVAVLALVLVLVLLLGDRPLSGRALQEAIAADQADVRAVMMAGSVYAMSHTPPRAPSTTDNNVNQLILNEFTGSINIVPGRYIIAFDGPVAVGGVIVSGSRSGQVVTVGLSETAFQTNGNFITTNRDPTPMSPVESERYTMIIVNHPVSPMS